MSDRRHFLPLVVGLLLIVLGSVLLIRDVYALPIGWVMVARYVLPSLFLWLGLAKLLRHFRWGETELIKHPRRASLLGGISWVLVGALILLDAVRDIEVLSSFADYWPLILILFGAGKIADFYRFRGRLPLRAGECLGIVFVILLGFASAHAAKSPFRLIDLDLGWVMGKKKISLGGAHHQWQTKKRISAEGVQLLEVANSYGDVVIDVGDSDAIEVWLSKVIFRKSRGEAHHIADQLLLRSDRINEIVRVRTNRKDLDPDYQFKTHVKLRIPESLGVKVLNSYGDVKVSRLKAPCNLTNSGGEVVVQSIQGEVNITNRYRSVTVTQVEGNLAIRNSRGEVRVEDIEGAAEITTDYDSISVKRIDGDLKVRNHFGQVTVEDVTGQVAVEGSGSEVRVSDIDRDLRIKNSHRGVRVSTVAKQVELDTSYSQVELNDILGSLDVRAAHSEIRGKGLFGDVTVRARGSAIELSDIAGPVDVATSLRAVRLSGFRGAAEIQNEFEEIVLSPSDPLNGPLAASNRNGTITLFLPAGTNFGLSAQALGGKVISDFKPPSGSTNQDVQVLEFDSGQDRPQVRLQTIHSEIYVRKAD